MKILHIAPYNISGVPLTMVKAERALGHESRLITLKRDQRNFEEDICLGSFLWDQKLLLLIKNILYFRDHRLATNKINSSDTIPPIWKPANQLVEIMIKIRDTIIKPKIYNAIKKYNLDEFDVYQLDGGQGFFRFNDIIPYWHNLGKKVICCYYGNDLRRRGVIKDIDAVSDLNITVEWDHLDLHQNIHHVYYPFDAARFQMISKEPGDSIKIGHSPTNRVAKGSGIIINAVNNLKKKYSVELVLIENVSYSTLLKMRATCDIGIDQLGDLGYGISALEWLAMGIPVASCIAPEMEKSGMAHPLVKIDEQNIEEQLGKLIADIDYRRELGIAGRKWIEENHDAKRIVQQIHKLAGLI